MDESLPEVTLGEFRISGLRCSVRRAVHMDGIEILTVYESPSVDTGQPIPIHSIQFVPLQDWRRMPEGERVETIRRCVVEALKHEVDECLRIDGNRVRDPHPPDVHGLKP